MTKVENSHRETDGGGVDDGGVDRVDTVPPPPGEDDAYSAPTKMHLAPPEAVLTAMKEATARGLPLKPQALPSPTPEAEASLVEETEAAPASTAPASTAPEVLTEPVDKTELSIANVIDHVNRRRVAIPLNVLVAIGCVVLILLTMATLLLFVVD